jgi:hypothetical protein
MFDEAKSRRESWVPRLRVGKIALDVARRRAKKYAGKSNDRVTLCK